MTFRNAHPRLVIIGNGLAGMRLLELLIERQARYRITVLSEEPVPGYNRIMLSPLLAGQVSQQAITQRESAWYREQQVDLRLNTRVQHIDPERQEILCTNGEVLPYDKVVMATGSKPFIPELHGSDLPGVMGFRDIADVDRMLDASREYQQAVVVGGGLLGIEAAVGLVERGMTVTLLHRNPVLMNRQIDRQASELLREALQQRGIDVKTQTQIKEIVGDERVEAVALNNGERLPAQLLVFATGIRPNVVPVRGAGVAVNQGVVVDNTMATSVPHLYALGECIEFEGNTYGLVAPLWDQARVLADHLVGKPACYTESDYPVKLKVTGIDVHSLGQLHATDKEQELIYLDAEAGIYKRVLLRDHKVVGALLIGDVADSQWYYELMQQQLSVRSCRQYLLLGRAFCEAALEQMASNDSPSKHAAA